MEMTVQLVVRNNKETIAKSIESVRPLSPHIIVGDTGSSDGTTEICRRMGCHVVQFQSGTGHDEIRNALAQRSNTDWQMYLNPWEVLVQGHREVTSTPASCQEATILQNSIISKEPRIWKKSSNLQFANPVYEHLKGTGECSNVCFYSLGNNNYDYNLSMVKTWKDRFPTHYPPCYYYAVTLMALGRYDSFINASEHYMFMDKSSSKTATLNRYYYALINVCQFKKMRPALQNINICIATHPLMAEFWCLIGDVYYHLLNKFTTAKEFYENAILLGSRRLAEDGWPMDLSKYDEYPNKMISSCNEIIAKNAIYIA